MDHTAAPLLPFGTQMEISLEAYVRDHGDRYTASLVVSNAWRTAES